MALAKEPKLRIRTMIPVFELMSAEGKAINVWNYKGFTNLAIVFLPPGKCDACWDFVNQMKQSYHRFEEEHATPLVIILGNQKNAISLKDELDPPFPVLYDDHGNVTAQYTDTLPAVFVADRFGELYAEWIVGEGKAFPSQKDILDVIELINLECPECGAPLDWR